MIRTYKTIKWVLKHHINSNVRSLWTWKNDNFTMIYENYDGDDRIYTSQQPNRSSLEIWKRLTL